MSKYQHDDVDSVLERDGLNAALSYYVQMYPLEAAEMYREIMESWGLPEDPLLKENWMLPYKEVFTDE